MTCIATDGHEIAGDGLAARDDMVLQLDRDKLFHGQDGSAIGCAGDGAAIELARDWFAKGEPVDQIPNLKGQDFSALILRPDGRVQLLDGLFVPYTSAAPAAIGAGDTYAMGALLAGAKPAAAVEIACRLSMSVGGKVRTLKPKAKK